MKNAVNRELPPRVEGYGPIKPFAGAWATMSPVTNASPTVTPRKRGESKILAGVEEALEACELRDGMTLSFHHHLRNGDQVLNQVMEAVDRKGIRNIHLAASSLFPIHEPLVALMEKGTVTRITTNYMSGPVAEAVSRGKLTHPAVMQTHGGRARAIEAGDLAIDIAFLAAPASDSEGNLNGVQGPSACGTLGYAVSDAFYARRVVAVTDHLVPYPNCPIDIAQDQVDYVVKVEGIGDPAGIVSGTTQPTRDPVGLIIAGKAAEVIRASGLMKEGFSFQTGAGGISLAVAAALKEMMVAGGIRGSFASGGITGYLVDMLREGFFQSLLDVQCFDLKAVESYRENPRHQAMSASLYGNPHNRGAVVNKLDIMILGATEIDLDFNVNVTTGSTGLIMGGSGGHSDTAAGARLAIVTAQLIRGRMPVIREKVNTVSTPGETIDVLVTERGIAVNPRQKTLEQKLRSAGLPVYSIQELKALAEEKTGKPETRPKNGPVVAVVEYRDGTVIDLVRQAVDASS